MWEISCTKGVGCSVCKSCQLNLLLFSNKQMLVAVVAKYVCGKLVVQSVLVAVAGKYVCGKLFLRMELVAVVANVVN